jgi:hypothetical protein
MPIDMPAKSKSPRHLLTFSILALIPLLGMSQEPVPARNARYHQVIFTNSYVRIIEVRIPPGDTTNYHFHRINSAIVFLSSNRTGSQLLGEGAIAGRSFGGNSSFATFGDSPVKHRVWNADSTLFHVLDIELIHAHLKSPDAGDTTGGLRLAWQKKEGIAYLLHLGPSEKTALKPIDQPRLLIDIPMAGSPDARKISQAALHWYGAQEPVAVRNRQKLGRDYVLLELN